VTATPAEEPARYQRDHQQEERELHQFAKQDERQEEEPRTEVAPAEPALLRSTLLKALAALRSDPLPWVRVTPRRGPLRWAIALRRRDSGRRPVAKLWPIAILCGSLTASTQRNHQCQHTQPDRDPPELAVIAFHCRSPRGLCRNHCSFDEHSLAEDCEAISKMSGSDVGCLLALLAVYYMR
jgi:hypothetical protein